MLAASIVTVGRAWPAMIGPRSASAPIAKRMGAAGKAEDIPATTAAKALPQPWPLQARPAASVATNSKGS
jgi:hypothetical protein